MSVGVYASRQDVWKNRENEGKKKVEGNFPELKDRRSQIERILKSPAWWTTTDACQGPSLWKCRLCLLLGRGKVALQQNGWLETLVQLPLENRTCQLPSGHNNFTFFPTALWNPWSLIPFQRRPESLGSCRINQSQVQMESLQCNVLGVAPGVRLLMWALYTEEMSY